MYRSLWHSFLDVPTLTSRRHKQQFFIWSSCYVHSSPLAWGTSHPLPFSHFTSHHLLKIAINIHLSGTYRPPQFQWSQNKTLYASIPDCPPLTIHTVSDHRLAAAVWLHETSKVPYREFFAGYKLSWISHSKTKTWKWLSTKIWTHNVWTLANVDTCVSVHVRVAGWQWHCTVTILTLQMTFCPPPQNTFHLLSAQQH